MIDQDRLSAFAETYLKSLISEATDAVGAEFDAFAPFGELGIDSFRVLKIVKALEADFGTLPKTLLFENFNINDLARYFVERHAATLSAKLAGEGAAVSQAVVSRAVAQPPAAVAAPARPVAARPIAARPILLLEKDAHADPELGPLVRDLFDRFKNDGSVSRGTRNIAPNLFIGSARKGYFHYSRSRNIILAYGYTGPADYFETVAGELEAHCAGHGLELNLLAADELATIGGVAFSSTPFGVLQRVVDLPAFTLDGNAMRRLRYQVSKFQKAGQGRTEEFRCGASEETSRQIADMVDRWCAGRTMVNPLIHIVKDEILAGTLDPAHRIFLTYLDDVLQNVILISPLCAALNGYLMDLEFYHKDMPLGGLEFTIVNIVRVLTAEGCEVLSLGGTYGCKLEESSNADPEVDRILDDLRMQNIFNDEGNLQFKNKFRPETRTIYLCRPVGKCDPHNVIDIIMMIADPMKMQTSDAEHQRGGAPAQAPAAVPVAAAGAIVGIDGADRTFALARAGFNPLNLPHGDVGFDLKTDSWAQLQMPAIANQLGHLNAQLHRPPALDGVLREIVPFEHVVLTTSGRSAERVFYRAWPRKGLVPQNLLFPTTLFHQIDQGFTPLELPHSAALQPDAPVPFKGGLDLDALERRLAHDAAQVAMVCIELSNNAAGGCPVALGHLKQVRALLGTYSIPLILDATRVLENARCIIDQETDYAGRPLWQVVREVLAQADGVVASLPKDFCIARGGLVATNDPALFARLQEVAREEGCGLSALDRKRLALALSDRDFIEAQSRRRQDVAGHLWTTLQAHGIPVAHPAGAHCVLIDVARIPAFRALPHPVASFLAWLYVATGIRAAGHNAGMQKNGALNNLVRLAIPVGLKREEADDIAQRIVAAFAAQRNIPDVDAAGGAGDIHARYRLNGYLAATGALVAEPEQAAAEPAAQPPAATAPAASPASRDIAIVGMAGRYPKADNLAQLWDNLLGGADCIEAIPEQRLAQRARNARRYRGGFIDGVDCFDASFFGISARDAAIMDPHERQFLEVAYEAVEDAGYYPETLGGPDGARDIGVFVGAVWSSYQMIGQEEKAAGRNVDPSAFLWSIANRVSYWMNLSGPSLTLDTACAASLTAIKLACDAIHSGECAAAIAGGVNLDLHQSKFDINASGGSLSPDGVCRSFGKGANGYVSGEGVGAVLLKPLARAIADGDQIHGVIRSAVVTHSGRTSAYTVPSPRPQAALVAKALAQARIDARTIGYVEGHATGTDLGDSIEMAALADAFGRHGADTGACALGSVKTNIGHLEAASGIAGLHKILLQMKHRKLVPSLHAAAPNENIDFANSPFRVQQEVADWQPKDVDGVRHPLRAGISTIGIGGTLAHVIVEAFDAAPRDVQVPAQVDRIYPLSARTPAQLKLAAARLRDCLARDDAPDADDIAYTLQVGRKCFDHRLAIVARSKEALADRLAAFLAGEADDDVMPGHVKNASAVTGLLNAREKQDFVSLLVQSRDPRRLARLWSDGVIADWQGVDVGQAGRRVSLPTYPFARERHWIAANPPSGLDAAPAPLAPAAPVPPLPLLPQLPLPRAEEYHFAAAEDAPAPHGRRLDLDAAQKALLFVRQAFAGRLGLPVGQLDADAHLMETGVTSLDMAQMTQAFKQRFDPAFSPTVFFECTTLATLADQLGARYAGVFDAMTVTRLAAADGASAAVAVATASAPAPQERSTAPATASHVDDAASALPQPGAEIEPVYQGMPRAVLLTGATGFLGIHVLAECLAASAELRVVCLVRAQDREHGMERIRTQAANYELTLDEDRIDVVCGDINRPALGLTPADWDRCARDVDQIVHASAHVNHIEGYATFRESTHGMKEIIRLASTCRLKLVQFVSSTAACFHKAGAEFSVFEREAFIPDGAAVYGGYGQSKWVQETFLERAAGAGLPYVIYRFGELSGSSRTGIGQTDDMLHRLLQMRLAIGCREKISSDVLDMVPVDVAARLIAGTGNAPPLWNRIVHATHLKPYSFANLYRRAQASGLQFAPVTREQYLERCYDFVRYVYSVSPVHGFVLECVLRDAEGSVRKRKIMDGYFAVLFPFAQDNFKRSLQFLGLSLPDWPSLLDGYFSRWSRADCGFLARIYDYQTWRQARLAVPEVVTETTLEDVSEA